MKRAADTIKNLPRSPVLFESANAVESLVGAVREVGGARWCLAVTFSADGPFVEQWADALGVDDLLVLTDTLESPVVSRPTVARFLLASRTHAKVVLIRGPHGVVCQVGSANLTAYGVGGSFRDVVWTGTVDTARGPRAEIQTVCEWLDHRLSKCTFKPKELPRWQERLSRVRKLLSPARQGELQFLHNDAENLAGQLRRLVGRLQSGWIVSPYVDGRTVSALGTGIHVLIPTQVERRRLHEMQKVLDPDSVFRQWKPSFHEPFTHAKLYLLTGSKGSILAFGSANCTEAGLSRTAQEGGRSEVLLARRISRSEYGRLSARLQSDTEPLPAAPGDTPEDPEKIEPATTLLVWATPDYELEVMFPEGVELAGAPVLARGGPRRKGRRLTIHVLSADTNRLICEVSQDERNEWRRIVDTQEPGWRVDLGSLSGPVTFLADVQAQDQGVAELWGGELNSTAWQIQVSSREADNASAQGPRGAAVLDEYERRSARVTRALTEEIQSRMPERLGLFEQLWEQNPGLGLEAIGAPSVDGAQLFLGLRLLGVLNAKSKLHPEAERFRSSVERDVARLSNTSAAERRQFGKAVRRWTGAKHW